MVALGNQYKESECQDEEHKECTHAIIFISDNYGNISINTHLCAEDGSSPDEVPFSERYVEAGEDVNRVFEQEIQELSE